MANLELKKVISDNTYDEYNFYISDNIIYLDEYRRKTIKEGTKRSYIVAKFYVRLSTRNSNIQESDVPFDDDIRKEVIEKYCSTIVCKKWSERNVN